ncbi:MAG TPA: dTDP-glucose 4,6-dehydratase [Bryobacteraceae bacterium]|jgi:dTDP-glucose 4,6-dehydratase|nr:dTDP-glucose 4,6-dehydratase [Bryobacteraceae bacterium]
MKFLVTGGAGFIGSAFVRMLLDSPAAWSGPAAQRPTVVANFDKLTYAGNLENLAPVAEDARYRFVHGDICDAALVNQTIAETAPDVIVNFAAESHVDRSILSPAPVFETNLRGTFTLLEAARTHKTPRFLHVSTDEVYGSIPEPHDADENYPLRASSPYSASKAGSDLLALSYFVTYGMPVTVTRASNNYGPYQFPEKLIPLMISNAIEDKALPIYGDGMQVRDWLYVDDHCRAILSVIERGRAGEIYNIGGSRALPNLEVVERILDAVGKPRSLMQTVKDRPGHDRRYALSTEKLMRETGWQAQMPFEAGLRATIDWYRGNAAWIARVKSGEYQNYYQRNYANRAM